MKRIQLLHPFLFAIFPVIYIYSRNGARVPVHLIVVPLLALLLLAFVLLKIAPKIFDDKDAAALSVSGFFSWLFSYSAVQSLFALEIGGTELHKHRYFIVIWIIALVVSLVGLKKARVDYHRVAKYFNILAPLLILLSLLNMGIHVFNKAPQQRYNEGAVADLRQPVQNDSLPDVYYIILDAYTGQEGLDRYLRFDNRKFIQYLNDKGFYVAKKSRSNYSWTRLSLASSLNMDYLPMRPDDSMPVVSLIDDSVSDFEMITHSKVVSLFQSFGYEYLDLAIWNVPTSSYPSTSYNQLVANDFNIALLQLTLLNRPLVLGYFLSQAKREGIIKKFEDLKTLSPSERPRFVYAHFLVPHHPYTFDKNGNELSIFSMIGYIPSERELYAEQLLYVNKEMRKTIDAILENSRRKSIIIIQGDHGAYQLGKTESDNKKLRMSILNAYYVPESCKTMLYDTISPVNTFRIILNCCYGQDYPLLPEKSYFSRFETTQKVEDVTDQLAGGE